MITLEYHESGVVTDLSRPEQNVQVCQQLLTFLHTIVEDNLAQERLITCYHLVITYTTFILREGVANDNNSFW